MSREDSLATVVLRFTGMFPGELHSGRRRKRYTVDLSRVLQLLMELRSQRSSACFPSPRSETAKLLHVVSFYSYGARVQGNSSSDLNLFGRALLSSAPSELPSPLACPFLNGGSAYHHRTSLSTSGFDGHSACSGELVSPPVSTIYLSVDVYCTISDLQFRSTMSRTLPATASEPKRYVPKWAWPNSFIEATKVIIKNLKPIFSNQNMRYIAVGMAFLVILKMFDVFFGINKLRLLQYYLFWKNFYVGSPTLVWVSSSSSNEESFSQLCLPSMNGDALSDSLLSPCFNLLTGLLLCVMVCTGPESAIETTSVFLVGEGCLPTSLVTFSQLSDFVVASSTHSNFVLNSLSVSYGDLSCLISFAILVYDFLQKDV
ncbi:hypothetical protein Bca4012_098099 [Brassica carinata]|uniref:Uncharacterized protein n=1 Tax=Brassica carinata TaxID=52824 RepID=A0A8X7PE11_BRACI|nr:hypothetical protein Bca52824_080790 [Brassica carinata]